VAATRVLAARTERRFEVNFDESVVCGPVLYGPRQDTRYRRV
jgi:hypothetical protein